MGVTILFLLILVGVLLLLLNPLTYFCEVLTYRPMEARAEATWWGKLFSFKFHFQEGKPLYRSCYVLGSIKAGQAKDYEEWLAKRVKEELKESYEEDEEFFKEELEQKEEDSPEKEEKKKNNRWKAYIWRSDLHRAVLTLLRRIYDHSKPRKLELKGRIGFGDPCYTGMFAGLLYSFWPEYMDEVEFDFLDISYGGRWYIEGRIYPIVLIWYFIRFALTKPIPEIIRGQHKED